MLEYRCIFCNLSSAKTSDKTTTILENRTQNSKGDSKAKNAKRTAITQNKVSQRLDVKCAYSMQPALMRKVEPNWN